MKPSFYTNQIFVIFLLCFVATSIILINPLSGRKRIDNSITKQNVRSALATDIGIHHEKV